jgi:hypothetical protein
VLQAEVTFNPDTYGPGFGIDVGGVAQSNAADVDAGTFNGTDTVTVTVPALAPGANVVITFQATVD